ncbi:MAG: tRNA lysidine(34) synthetase TilS [Oscillospiraceae bacterium]|nr:tRNA lysidine(34) synthetase TilS [Oscillospiraceae bacterium]
METTKLPCAPAHPLELKALEQLKQHGLVQPGDRVIAAVSGGADSMALLLFFLRWGEHLAVTVEAAHIDHGLRGEDSARDAAFVEEFCAAHGVPLHLHRAQPPAGSPGEDWARRQRYAFFDRLTADGAKLATAHTLNDQAETLLLRLARGCSTAGAAGIPVRRGAYIRPFLTVERTETEDYCRTCGQTWREDATNAGDDYARNRVRHTALPALETVNPRAAQALARFSARMALVDGYLTAQADTLLQQAACEGGWQAALLAAAHPAVRDQALAALLGADAQEALVARLAALLAAGQGSVNLPRRGRAVLAEGVLRLEPAEETLPDVEPAPFLAPGVYHWPDGRSLHAEVLDYEKFIKLQTVHKKDLNSWADYDKIQQYSPILRTRLPGDRFAPEGRGCTKTLKKWLNELHIPPRARALLPLVAEQNGGRVLWLCGHGFARGLAPDKTTRRVLRLTVQQENETGDI